MPRAEGDHASVKGAVDRPQARSIVAAGLFYYWSGLENLVRDLTARPTKKLLHHSGLSTWRLFGLGIRFNISGRFRCSSVLVLLEIRPAMEVRLVLDKGSVQRKVWHLHHKDTIVGRRRDCHLRIRSAEVSRRHCLLSIQEDHVDVEDLDSINGTFVNGERVVGKQTLRPGDHLEIGPLEFIVEYELSPAALERLEQANAVAGAEESAVLPLCDLDVEEGAAAVVAEGAEQRDAPPVVDEDTEVSDQAKKTDAKPSSAARDEEEPLPILDEEAANWQLPQTSDLRDLLAQMDAPKSRPRQRER
jgi:FHA domain